MRDIFVPPHLYGQLAQTRWAFLHHFFILFCQALFSTSSYLPPYISDLSFSGMQVYITVTFVVSEIVNSKEHLFFDPFLHFTRLFRLLS